MSGSDGECETARAATRDPSTYRGYSDSWECDAERLSQLPEAAGTEPDDVRKHLCRQFDWLGIPVLPLAGVRALWRRFECIANACGFGPGERDRNGRALSRLLATGKSDAAVRFCIKLAWDARRVKEGAPVRDPVKSQADFIRLPSPPPEHRLLNALFWKRLMPPSARSSVGRGHAGMYRKSSAQPRRTCSEWPPPIPPPGYRIPKKKTSSGNKITIID